MRRFVDGIDREQATLYPECLEDWIDQDNPVRAVDAFVDNLDLPRVGFDGVAPEATGRPSYHPSGLLKLYIYGYLNRVQSSRRLEREAGRNVEVMWLTCRLVPEPYARVGSALTLALAASSHLLRISSSSSSVRCSRPMKEFCALLARINSSSLTWMAAASRF
jgi:Transposase domain (DUF772)